MIVAGIDPGQQGGIAVLSFVPMACAMPLSGKEVDCRTLAHLVGGADFVVVEKAQAMPKQGVTGMFRYGVGFGKILGLLEGLSIPHVLVTPQAWKKVVLAGTAKDKDAAVNFVRRAHPWADLTPGQKRKPHDGIADAICIAEYALRHHKAKCQELEAVTC